MAKKCAYCEKPVGKGFVSLNGKRLHLACANRLRGAVSRDERRGKMERGNAFLFITNLILAFGLGLAIFLLLQQHKDAMVAQDFGAKCLDANKQIISQAIDNQQADAHSIAMCEGEKSAMAAQIETLTLNQTSCPVTVVFVDKSTGIQNVRVNYQDGPQAGAAA